MAIQDFVDSQATHATVSKAQIFRFLEVQFERADRDRDGALDPEELALFVYSLSTRERDRR